MQAILDIFHLMSSPTYQLIYVMWVTTGYGAFLVSPNTLATYQMLHGFLPQLKGLVKTIMEEENLLQ